MAEETAFSPATFFKVYAQFHIDKARSLGAGGFGKVYLITRRLDGKLFAAKYQKLRDRGTQKMVRHEAAILSSLKEGERVVELLDYFEKSEHSLMVLEYLQEGELFKKIGSKEYDLTEEKCKRFVKEIVKGLMFIHAASIIHLDLKPQNIMLVHPGQEFRLKLIDFGLAKRLNSEGFAHSGFCGTVGFMAPEVAHCQYTTSSLLACPPTDYFSLGVIVYMLLSGGREPFWDVTELKTLRNTLRKEAQFHHSEWKHVSQDGIHFIKGCLAKEARERPTGRACLSHPWLREERSGPTLLHRLETLRMRRFLARYRWRRAIREVRMLVKVRNSFLGIPEDLE